jgi:hypothetical protein
MDGTPQIARSGIGRPAHSTEPSERCTLGRKTSLQCLAGTGNDLVAWENRERRLQANLFRPFLSSHVAAVRGCF